MNTAKHVLFLVMLSFLALLAGCEEDTINPPTGTTDTIAPFVTRTIPALFDIGIAVDAPIIITFSEAINPATLDRSISISSGDITGITPISTSQYRIDHTPWNEGVQVSVALGTGITDTAGNALATDFLISFWTTTTDVLLLNTLPAHKAVDVSRNSQVRLRFSSRMDSLSLAGAMNISTGTRKTIGVRAMEIQDDWVILSFNEPLPASTRITITIASSAMDIDGRPLAAPVLYFFTTGIDLDRSAPTILSFEPANGAIITADLQFLRVTFSEPIDDTHFVPSVFSGSFAMELFRVGADPVWTKNYTVLTIPLSGMMPAGAIIFLGFDSFSDLNGNTNPSGFSYRLTIEGEPDLFPVVDGEEYMMAGLMDFSWPNERKTVPTPTAYLKKISTQTNGQIWLMQRQIFEDAYNYWDILKKTPTAVQLLGMHEYDWETTTAYNTLFSEPINLFRLPVVPQTWSGTSSFVVDQIPFDVVYNNEILEGTFDITLVTTDPPVIEKGNSWIRKHLNKRSSDRLEIVWFGCRKILSNTVISFTNRTTQSITETYWQAPGVGEIRYMTTEIQYLDPLDPSIFQTFNMDVYRMPLAISRKRKLN